MQCSIASVNITNILVQRSDQPSTHERVYMLTALNYRAISLISISGKMIPTNKVFCKMIHMRIDDNIDTHLSKQQFGFTKKVIFFTVRQIKKKANEHRIPNEHRVPLHFNCLDFKVTSDVIWIGTLWKILRSIGVDPKITSLLEAMYDNVKCAVVINQQNRQLILFC